jgi:pimeloyl-ACP methyl ester carboxylesterase
MSKYSLEHGTQQVNGIRMHFIEQGEGVPVLLLHGFPELCYAWLNQLPALGFGGFRAIAPDLRGYGETEKPAGVEEYDIHHLVGDLTGLLDALSLRSAVLVGHDWGGLIAWQMALMQLERVERVISLGTPYWPGGFPEDRAMSDHHYLPDRWGAYVLDVDQPELAESTIGSDLALWLEMIQFRRLAAAAPPAGRFPARHIVWRYAESLSEGGLTGPINYFRNIRRNFETTAHLHDRQIQVPALLISGERDLVTPAEDAEGMEQWVPNLTRRVIDDCGHWMHGEMPDDVNDLMLEFLRTMESNSGNAG